MNISSKIKDLTGVITIQVEGFFTERFINLCKINNIKIWDIRQIVQGVIRLNIHIADFKKLKPIARKTKCKVKIKKKKGIYFKIFKYRNRKIYLYIISFLIIFILIFYSFIWNIKITGNEGISNEKIIEQLKSSGLYVGKCKIGLSKQDITNNLRANMPELSWAGLSINGIEAQIEIVEKAVSTEKGNEKNKIGDIIAQKPGIITKIVVENGTAKYKQGSYIEKDTILIEGIINSTVIEPEHVMAKGLVRVNNEYIFEKEYNFLETIKEYTNSKRYTIGISYNSKENMLNYLNKSKKYDKLKKTKSINIFGNNIGMDFYTCLEYEEVEVNKTKEELINMANEESTEYINNLIKEFKLAYIDKDEMFIEDTPTGIKFRKKFVVNEQIGEFVERNN